MRRLLPLRSFRAKLILAFMILLLLPTLGIGLYGHYFTTQTLSNNARSHSIDQVRHQGMYIVTALDQVRGDVLYLGGMRSLHLLRDALMRGTSEAEITRLRGDIAEDWLTLASVRPMYYRLRYINGNGQEIVSIESDGSRIRNKPPGALADQSDQPFFREIMALDSDAIYISSFDVERSDSNTPSTPILRYAIKLDDFTGFVMIDLRLSWLLRDLAGESEGTSWALVNQDGMYLAYPSGYDQTREINDKLHLTETLSPMLDGKNGFLETDSNVFVYDTVRPNASFPDRYWVIFRDTPKSVLYAELTIFYQTGMIILLGAFMLALAIALAASEHIAMPIRDLKHMVEQYGKSGKRPELPKNPLPDEIGGLGIAFCTMARELEQKRRQERNLIERLITAQEEERRLVAYDLHDGLIQQMVGARFHLTTCRARCPVNGQGDPQSLSRSCDVLSDAIVEGRRIIEGLRPAALDDLGLEDALKELAQSTAEASGWSLALNFKPLPNEPDTTVGVTLYRIAQEALNNARKHAEAEQVCLTLENGQGISLTIQDNGLGFDVERVRQNGHGLGLTTLHERAHLLGGTCEIESTSGKGTIVRVWVPCETQGEDEFHVEYVRN